MSRRIWITLAIMVAIAAGGFTLVGQFNAAINDVVMHKYLMMAMTEPKNKTYVADVTTVTAAGAGTARVFHAGSAERMQYPGRTDRSAWSITKDGKSYTYLPRSRQLLVSDTGGLSAIDRFILLRENYRYHCLGEEKIAGRDTYVVTLTSRRTSNLAKKLWIDKEQSIILRSEDYTASGQLQSRTETTRISYDGKIDPQKFALPKGTSPTAVCESCTSSTFRSLGFRVTQPRYIPAGYKLDSRRILHSTCGCSHTSAQFTYTDGLKVISVFETPKMVCCKDCGSHKCSDQNCGIATLGQVTRSDKTIVVVGDLLPKELNRIAESVD